MTENYRNASIRVLKLRRLALVVGLLLLTVACSEVEALAEGSTDAVAKGEIGNRDDAHESGGAFVVTAPDSEPECGGFSLASEDAELRSCLDDKIDYLTDCRRIGYAEWREDSSVFMRRAEDRRLSE